MRAVHRVIAVVPGELTIPAGWDRVLILLLAAAAVLVQFMSAFDEFNQRTVGPAVGIELLNPDLTVKTTNAMAAQTGVRVGDRLLKLNGVPVTTVYHYRRLLNNLPLGSHTWLVVGRGGTEFEIGPVTVTRDDLDGMLLATRQLAGLTCTIVATWVGLVRPGVRAAQLFFLAASGLGTYFVLLGTRNDTLVYIQAVALTLTPALALHFFLTFPKEWNPPVSKWWPLLYVPSLILLVLTVAAFRETVRAGIGIYGSSTYWLLHNQVDFVFLAISGAFGLVALIRGYARADSPVERRRLQWIIWGLGIASLAAVVDLFFTQLQIHTPQSSTILLLGVLPLPLAFAFSILRYRLWAIDTVLSRSAVYGLLTAVLAAVYVLLIGVLSLALASTTHGINAAVILFLSALVIGILASPLRARIQSTIDRVFFRSAVDYQRVLASWSEKLSTSLRFADLAALLLREAPDVLQLEHAWLLVLTQDETMLQPMAGASATDDQVSAALSISAHGALAAELARRPGSVLLYDQPDLVALHRDVLGQWRALGVRVLLPLVSGGKLVGIYLLGAKLSGDVYQRTELEMLRTLANQSAVAISNARLYEQVHDFSQEMETKVRERTKELRDSVSVVYHELSTPITAVRGYTEALIEGRPGLLTDRQSRYLDIIQRSALRLTALVTDLSDVSKIDDGRLTIHPELMDLEEAVDETLTALSGIIEEKGLQVSTHLAEDATWVVGDPRRVVQILTNLVGNACRYTPAGGRVAVCATCVDGWVEVTITDTGIGIPKEELETIFDRFYRSPDPFVQAQPGTGLGLSITRSLVELHGSLLWVTSTVGKGSTFGFALPVREAVDD